MKVDNMKKTLLALGVAAVMGLAGCGGDGAGKGGNPQGALTGAEEEQDVQVTLSASSQVLPADGSGAVDLMAAITNDDGVAIEGKTVSFAARDAANGVRIEITRAETDAAGTAVARLLLNGVNTERDVTVLASVDQKTPAELVIRVSTAAQGSAVGNSSRGELTVRLGTDNLIENMTEQLSYRKRYAAIVTDNAGIPKPNATVLATLRSTRYYVGYWAKPESGNWFQVQMVPEGIASEDVTNYGVCDSGEDINGDQVLTPGNVASYTVQSQTDSNGVAVLNIVYPKSFAQWAQMQLEVTATVGGTEGYNAITIPLPILASDVTNADVPPPSISRTRQSLGTTLLPMPIGTGDEGDLGLTPSPNSILAGSPFPYQSVTRTCPLGS
jgi:hypothetical protein